MRKQILFGLVTAALVLVLACSVSGVAFGKPQHSVKTDGKTYRQMEEIYMEQVKGLLEEEGLASAGVTLTYERDREGMRHYTLQIHHHRLESLEVRRLNMIKKQMEACFFEDETCSINAQLVWQL